MNSDTLYQYWASSGGCQFTRGANGLTVASAASTACMLQGGGDGSRSFTLHPFSAWHRFKLDGLAIAADAAAVLVLTPAASNVTTVSPAANTTLSISTAGVTLDWWDGGSKASTVLVRGKHKCVGQMRNMSVEFKMNVVDFALAVSCSNPGIDGITSNGTGTDSSSAWEGKHGLNFRSWGNAGDGSAQVTKND